MTLAFGTTATGASAETPAPTPASGSAPVAPVPPPAKPSDETVLASAEDGSDANPIVGEDTGARSRYSKTFELADGSFSAVSYPFPVHFKSGGRWKDIDNSLTAGTDVVDEAAVYDNAANPLGVRFARRSASKRLVSMTSGKHVLSWYFDGQARVKAVLDDAMADSGATSNRRRMGLSKIRSGLTYPRVFPGVDVQYVNVSDTVKENIVLRDRSAQHVFDVVLRTGGLTATVSEDRSVSLVDPATGKVVFSFAAPYMVDAGGVRSDDVAVTLENLPGHVYRMRLTVNDDWLDDPDREWPVTVDPSVTGSVDASGMDDIYVNSVVQYPTDEFYPAMGVGTNSYGDVSRAVVGLPEIPPISEPWYKITNAQLRLTSYLAGSAMGTEINNFAANMPLWLCPIPYSLSGTVSQMTATWAGMGWDGYPNRFDVSSWCQSEGTQYVNAPRQYFFDIAPEVIESIRDGGTPRYSGFAIMQAGGGSGEYLDEDEMVWFATKEGAWASDDIDDIPLLMVNYVVDRTPPTASISIDSTVPESGWYAKAPTLTFHGSDDQSGVGSIRYSVSGAETITNATGATYTPSKPGTYTVTATVTDKVGNTSTAPEMSFNYDPTPPTGRVRVSNSAPSSGWYKVAPTATFHGEDATSGVRSLTYSVTGAVTVTNAGVEPGGAYVPSVGGTHVVTATVTDFAGNEYTTEPTTVQFDPEAPVASITASGAPGPNGWYTTAPTLTFHAADELSGVEKVSYSVSGSVMVISSATTDGGTYKITAPGSYVVTETVTDAAGNVATANVAINYNPTSVSLSIGIDPAVPDGPSSTTYPTAPTLTFNASDPQGVRSMTYTVARRETSTVLSGATTDGGTYTPTKADTYTVTLTVTNNAGVVATAIRVFMYDDEAPVISLDRDSAAATDWTAADVVDIGVTDTPRYGTHPVKVAYGTYSLSTFPVAKARDAYGADTVTKNGVYTYYAEDLAGNASVASITVDNVMIRPPLTGYSRSDTDLSVAAPGFPTTFTRTYDSTVSEIGPFGKGWMTPYHATCADYTYLTDTDTVETLPSIKVVTIPGVTVGYFRFADGTYSGVNTRDTLTRAGDGVFTLTRIDHTVYTFDASGFLTTITDANSNTVTITLNTNHLPTSVTDPVGRSFTIGYTSNLITAITDPAGRTVTYTYNNSRLASSASPSGATTTTYGYDSKGRLTTVGDGFGNTRTAIFYVDSDSPYRVDEYTNDMPSSTTYRYSTQEAGPLTITTTSPEGPTTAVYDGWGRQTYDGTTQYTYTDNYPEPDTSTDTDNNVTSYAYEPNGAQGSASTTNPAGEGIRWISTAFTYSGTTATRAIETNTSWDPDAGYAVSDKRVTTSTWDTKGNLTRQEVKDTADGKTTTETTTYTYNEQGLVAAETRPDGTTFSRTYDTHGNQTQETTTKSGSATTTSTATYNLIGFAVTQTGIDGTVSQRQYDLLGNVVMEASSQGGAPTSVSRSVYDAHGRLTFTVATGQGPCAQDTRTTNAAGLVTVNTCSGTDGTSYAYDKAGNTALLNRYGRVTRSFYDEKGRLTRQIEPDQYDPALDNLALNTYSDPNVGERYTYDANGNILTHTTKAGYATTNTYDVANKLIKTECAGKIVRNVYDQSGNLTQTIYPNQYNAAHDGLTKTPAVNTYGDATVGDRYTYDASGNKVTYTDPQNVQTNFTSDDAGHIIKAVTNQQVTRYIYVDENLTQVVHPNQYNAAHDGLTKTPATNTYSDTMVGDRYTYDDNGKVLSYTDSNGKVTNNVYGTNDKLAAVAASDGSRQTYDPTGTLINETLPNGTVNTIAHTPTGAIKSITASNGIDTTYGYDNSGLTTSYTHGVKTYTYTHDASGEVASMSVNAGLQARYEYDLLGQLTREDNHDKNQTVTYAYDAVGNLLTTRVYPYTTGAVSPVGATNVYTNTYDTAGRMTTWRGAALPYDQAGNLLGFSGATYTWKNGQLSGHTAAGRSTSYTYGSDNLRTGKNVAGTSTSFTVDPNGNVISQTSGTTELKFYRSADTTPQYFTLNGIVYHYERNLQGDITGILDANKNEIVAYTYDAWGKPITISGSAATTIGTLNPLRYKGYYYDNESGLYYLQNRYYSPELTRFISADAEDVSFAQNHPLRVNLYTYCLNNPITSADPTGRNPIIDIIILIYDILSGKFTKDVLRAIIANPAALYITQNGLFPEVFKFFGFVRDKQGVYHATTDCLQKWAGYNDIYDWIFDKATDMKKGKFTFSFGGIGYIFWVWKGDYLNLGAGTELGFYRKPGKFGDLGHWLAADDDMRAGTVSLKSNKESKPWFTTKFKRHWWWTGFYPAKQGVHAAQLQATFSISMNGSSRDRSIFKALKELWKHKPNWSFTKSTKMMTLRF